MRSSIIVSIPKSKQKFVLDNKVSLNSLGLDVKNGGKNVFGFGEDFEALPLKFNFIQNKVIKGDYIWKN